MPRLCRGHVDGRPDQVSICIDFGSVTCGHRTRCSYGLVMFSGFVIEAYLQVLFWEAFVFRT